MANQEEYLETESDGNKESSIHEIPLVQRWKPSLIKVEPKRVTMGLPFSSALQDTNQLSKNIEESNEESELDPLDQSNQINDTWHFGSKAIGTEPSEKHGQMWIDYNLKDNSENRLDSIDKQDDTNISAFKMSNTSRENHPKELKLGFSSDKLEYSIQFIVNFL